MKDLYGLLIGFLKKVNEKIRKKKRKGELTTVEIPSFKVIIEKKPRMTTQKKESSSIERYSSRDKSKLKEEIRSLENYDVILDLISEKYELDNPKKVLRRLIRNLIDKTIHKEKLDESKLSKIVHLFLKDLSGGSILYNPKFWLNGIALETDKINLTEKIKLGTPRKEDLTYELSLTEIPANPDKSKIIPNTSAILEFNIRAKGEPRVSEKLEGILKTLRLYKIGSIYYLKGNYNPKTILNTSGTVFTLPYTRQAKFKYSIDEDEKDEFKEFFKEVEPHILDLIGGENRNPTKIAFDRYESALIQGKRREEIITYGLMGLEALYLKGGEEGGLSERLAERITIVFEILGIGKPSKIYHKIKKAYDIRSNFVHGSVLEDKSSLKKLPKQILNFTRISLLLFLLTSKKKEGFIRLIDGSRFDSEKKGNLKKMLEAKCEIIYNENSS